MEYNLSRLFWGWPFFRYPPLMAGGVGVSSAHTATRHPRRPREALKRSNALKPDESMHRFATQCASIMGQSSSRHFPEIKTPVSVIPRLLPSFCRINAAPRKSLCIPSFYRIWKANRRNTPHPPQESQPELQHPLHFRRLNSVKW